MAFHKDSLRELLLNEVVNYDLYTSKRVTPEEVDDFEEFAETREVEDFLADFIQAYEGWKSEELEDALEREKLG